MKPIAVPVPQIGVGTRVSIPLGGGATLDGEVRTYRQAGDRLVLGLLDTAGRYQTVHVEPHAALGLAVVIPPVSLAEAISLAGNIIAGAEVRMPVGVAQAILARAVLHLADRVP